MFCLESTLLIQLEVAGEMSGVAFNNDMMNQMMIQRSYQALDLLWWRSIGAILNVYIWKFVLVSACKLVRLIQPADGDKDAQETELKVYIRGLLTIFSAARRNFTFTHKDGQYTELKSFK